MREGHLDIFSAYNSALWPLAAALWLISLAVFVQVLRARQNDRAVTALLAVHWGWAGLAYHWAYFTAINPAAFAFTLASHGCGPSLAVPRQCCSV